MTDLLPSMFADGFAQPSAFTPSHDLEADVRRVLHEALQLGDEAWALRADSPLLGALPQLDSMGVLAVLTALEQQLGVPIHDDEIDASLFASFGTLIAFVRERLKCHEVSVTRFGSLPLEGGRVGRG